MKRKIGEILTDLPFDLYVKIRHEIDLQHNRLILDGTCSTLGQAIDLSIDWSNTSQGFDFWRTIKSNADNGKYNKKVYIEEDE